MRDVMHFGGGMNCIADSPVKFLPRVAIIVGKGDIQEFLNYSSAMFVWPVYL